MVILHFRIEMLFLNKNGFHLSKLPVFYINNSNRYRKHSLKIWADSDHFSRFHRYWKFKIQSNKSKWCKTFLMSIYYISRSLFLYLLTFFASSISITFPLIKTSITTCIWQIYMYTYAKVLGSVCSTMRLHFSAGNSSHTLSCNTLYNNKITTIIKHKRLTTY